MITIKGIIKNLEEIVACVFFSIMCSAVIIGVLARLFNFSIVWTDELSRYSFIWVVFIGSAAVLKRKKHITIEFLSVVVPKKTLKYLNTLIGICLISIFLVLIRFGILVTADTWSVPTTSLGIPTGLIYVVVPISGVLMTVYTILDLITIWRNKDGIEEPHPEERGVEI
ncbi:TRAP transporter small permease [Metabacillus arenae]|uniref:TRAP transporter small permease n=1 Tax=Metabacillus arenae TaxID=2771434 RepID=A0A926NMC0_9BACI|nr:TRAP transporter small permease [Metabacillus arenae]MBD1383340.1 TRAP transporter small permease [Metabacillus arenae]